MLFFKFYCGPARKRINITKLKSWSKLRDLFPKGFTGVDVVEAVGVLC